MYGRCGTWDCLPACPATILLRQVHLLRFLSAYRDFDSSARQHHQPGEGTSTTGSQKEITTTNNHSNKHWAFKSGNTTRPQPPRLDYGARATATLSTPTGSSSLYICRHYHCFSLSANQPASPPTTHPSAQPTSQPASPPVTPARHLLRSNQHLVTQPCSPSTQTSILPLLLYFAFSSSACLSARSYPLVLDDDPSLSHPICS